MTKNYILTPAQYHALKKYEDEQMHSIHIEGIKPSMFQKLQNFGYVREKGPWSDTARITPAGRSALERFEKKKREKQAWA